MSILLSLALSFPVLAQQQPEDGRGQGLFSSEWHAERRAALVEKVGKGVIVLRGAGTQNDYREFRQDNNFWYFTGVTTPNAVLVMVPSTGHQTMLVPHVSPGAEIWQGDLIDPEEAKHITGIEDCRLIGKIPGGRSSVKWDGLEDLLGDLAKEHDTFYVQGQPAENWMMSRDNLRSAAGAVRKDPYDGRKTREGQFAGMIDLFSGKATIYAMGRVNEGNVDRPEEVDMPAEYEEQFEQYRQALIEKVVETDEDLLIKYLEGEEIDPANLKRALRQATIDQKIVPVLCGSAMFAKGIHPLLDAVVDYLPSNYI